MQFAKRVIGLEPEGAYEVMAQAQALEAEGREIIHLEIGQPDFQTFPHISLRGIEAIAAGQTRYNPAAGLPSLREAIAADAGARRGTTVAPEQVVIGPGAKPALFFPTLALVEPGDEVLYPDPGFPTYAAMIEVAGGQPVPIPLLEENSFSFDLEVFDQSVSDRTRLVILNSPANPTGGVMPKDDLEQIAAAAHKFDFWVMSDEIYAQMVYANQPVPSIAALPGMSERTVIVDGFSKTYAMTGWRLGYGIMPESLAQRVALLLNHSVGCTATFTQIAGLAALETDPQVHQAVIAEYQLRRDRIVEGLNAIPGLHCALPQGAFYAFPNVKALGVPSRKLARQLLDEGGVALLPGDDFGQYGAGYLRLCYAVSVEEIERALERIADVLKVYE